MQHHLACRDKDPLSCSYREGSGVITLASLCLHSPSGEDEDVTLEVYTLPL